MNIYGFLSIIGVALLIVVVIILGGPVMTFVNAPSLLVTAGIAIGLQMIGVGRGAFADAWRTIQVLCGACSTNGLETQHAINLRRMTRYLYAAGGIGTMIGWIQILADLDGISNLGPVVAMSVLPLFYGVVLAECVVRPAANRIDYLLAFPKETNA